MNSRRDLAISVRRFFLYIITRICKFVSKLRMLLLRFSPKQHELNSKP
ncbi:hypothetical protein DFP91_0442 [Pseudorhodoplanes sinuspersici]|nr:hypothetical protein DFP91_0442 [Pseudorhodoplanes sinuspersici]